jgi:hypothetical protein
MNASGAPAAAGWLVPETAVLVPKLGDCEPAVGRETLAVDFPMGIGNRSQSRLTVLLLGDSLLLRALQTSCVQVTVAPTDWLASLSAVASDARPNGCWCCRGPRWLAITYFIVLVDQKLVTGLEMRCGRLPHNIKIITETIWEAAVFILPTERIYEVLPWDRLRRHDVLVHTRFLMISSGIYIIKRQSCVCA